MWKIQTSFVYRPEGERSLTKEELTYGITIT